MTELLSLCVTGWVVVVIIMVVADALAYWRQLKTGGNDAVTAVLAAAAHAAAESGLSEFRIMIETYPGEAPKCTGCGRYFKGGEWLEYRGGTGPSCEPCVGGRGGVDADSD